MLLVLDNCMHAIDAAAALVAALLWDAPHIRILATSREPLRTQGEHLCRLGPLDTPPSAPSISAAEALRYPSVQLFAEQAAASLDGFQLTDDDAPVVAEICRKLDGIPLALELAAARVEVLGLGGLAAQLEDRLRLLTGGRRTALPRHRTMRAALDWSYDQLSPAEQMVLRGLAVFAGGFTLAAAAGIGADERHPPDEVERLVLELAEKSLVVVDLDQAGPRFRLLDLTRDYALERARERGEYPLIARRHAAYFLELLEAASREREKDDEIYAAAEREAGNLRAALVWAFGPAGDRAIGVGLAAAMLPLWLMTSQLGEADSWIEKALQALDTAGMRNSRQEMVLRDGYGILLQIVRAGTVEAHDALSRARALARQFWDTDWQLQVLEELWVYHLRIGDVRTALDLARQAGGLATGVADPDAFTARWMLGIALHCAGERDVAQRHLEPLLRAPPPGLRGHHLRRAGFDQQVTTRYILGHALWAQGSFHEAAEAVRISVEEARRLQHPVTLCSVLAWGACLIALRGGDLDAASRSAEELVHLAGKHGFADHLSCGIAAQGIISLRKAGSNASIEQARTAFARWRASQWHIFLGICEFAEAAAAAGLTAEISAVVDEALQRAERNQELWAYPETLRVKGELLLVQEVPDPLGARQYFERSLARARVQGALTWQLRAAISLYRLALHEGEAGPLRALLSDVYGQFSEGVDSADLQEAKRLLAGAGTEGISELAGIPPTTHNSHL